MSNAMFVLFGFIGGWLIARSRRLEDEIKNYQLGYEDGVEGSYKIMRGDY